jgi:hydrogenase maturation protease
MDEGVGIHLVQSLAGQELPPDVEVMDGGTRGLDLLMLFQGRKLVVIVDCARMGEKPGTVRVFEAREIEPQQSRAFSVHGINLGHALELGERLGMLPEVVIVGVEPEKIGINIGLTDTLSAALPEIEKTVKDLIAARR